MARTIIRERKRGQSALEHLFNLACDNGHAHYAPEPMAWVGRKCGYKMAGKRCPKKLFFIRGAREIPVPKPRRKPSRLNYISRV